MNPQQFSYSLILKNKLLKFSPKLSESFRIRVGIFMVLLTLISCTNNDDHKFQNLNEFYAANLQPEVFTFKNNQDIKIVGRQGTHLSIPRTALSKVKGEIKISFKEFFKKSDLIFNNIPTSTIGNSWLETGGSFFLQIQDSTGKNIDFDSKILLEFPISSNIADTSNMSVWFGDGEAPIGTVRPFDKWRQATSQNSSANVSINREIQRYIMKTSNYNWINCDRFFNTTAELTKVKVTITNRALEANDVNTFIVLKNINSVLSLQQTNKTFESFPIPIGEKAFIVAIGINDGYYLYIKEVTITKNQALNIKLDPIKLDKLYDRIKALDN